MGNILACKLSSSPERTATENEGVKDPEHPGTMENLHRRSKDIFPSVFEGVRLLLNKSISKHLQVSHTIHLGGIDDSGYRFGAMYAGSEQNELGEHCSVLVGDIDPSGNLFANGVVALSSRITSKFCVQVINGIFPIAQMSADYLGDNSSMTLILANPNIIEASGTAAFQFLKQVTPRIALGAELACQAGNAIPGGCAGSITLGARWTGDTCIWSTTIARKGGHLCFYQRASDQLALGVEFEQSNRVNGSVATLGYIIELPHSEITIRGMLDSNGLVGATLEKKFEPLPVTFALSASLNHATGAFRLGCGLVIT